MIHNDFPSPQLRTESFDPQAAKPIVALNENKDSEAIERAFDFAISFAGITALGYFGYGPGNGTFSKNRFMCISSILTMGVGLVATSSGYVDIKNNKKVSGVAKLALGLLSFGAFGYNYYTNMEPGLIICEKYYHDFNNQSRCGSIFSDVQNALKKGEFDPIPALNADTYHENTLLCGTLNSTTLECSVHLKKEAAGLLDSSWLRTSSAIDSFKNASRDLLGSIPGCEHIKEVRVTAHIPKMYNTGVN